VKLLSNKKKILVVNKSFTLGGIQSALNNMLEFLNKDYDVDLLVFHNEGPLKSKLPKNIKLIQPNVFVETLGMSLYDALHSKRVIPILFKLTASIWSKAFNNTVPIKFALMMQKKICGYDIVISYHQATNAKTTLTGFNEFVLYSTKASLKIAWIHADFAVTGLGTKKNFKIYKKFDKIISVSKATRESFLQSYPELEDKCDYCYNFIPEDEVLEKSKRVQKVYKRSNDDFILFSACRFSKEKGLPRAISAIEPLIKVNSNIKWYIAGEGLEYHVVRSMIVEKGLEKNIILLGVLENPYPFIREADLFFLPSYHETFSMVVAESKVLGTKVLVTDIPVMHELISQSDGFICENSEDGIRKMLEEIINGEKVEKTEQIIDYSINNASIEKLKEILS